MVSKYYLKYVVKWGGKGGWFWMVGKEGDVLTSHECDVELCYGLGNYSLVSFKLTLHVT